MDNPAFMVGTSIFVATLLLLYLGSTLYHAWPQTPLKCVLQVIDHSAIFLLIAGTYTPFTLGPLRGPWGWSILCLVWVLAIGGVVMKIIGGIGRPKVSVCLYLGMGWLILVALHPLALSVPSSTVAWLIAGGLAYTGGVLFFVNEQVRYNHFIWHLFVLAGTACHFCAVFSYAA
jgi:hemolysin III